jgi:hypothetical protein
MTSVPQIHGLKGTVCKKKKLEALLGVILGTSVLFECKDGKLNK